MPGYWPQGFHPIASQAFMHGQGAHDGSREAFETRQPSAHKKAMQAHLMAAESHRAAAAMLHKQVAGTEQAKQLQHHQDQVQLHLDHARLHNDLAARPAGWGNNEPEAKPNPNLTYSNPLTYGEPKKKLGYGPGSPQG